MSKELRNTMPCGFDTKTGMQLNYPEVKCRPGDIFPINKLSDDQKRNLAIACWRHGCWEDMFLNDRKVTKEEAIEAAKEGTPLGNELVQLTMMGYEHIYDCLLPHDKEKYPLAKIVEDSELTTAASLKMDIPPASFTVCNNLSVSAYLYKADDTNSKFSYYGDIPTKSHSVYTPDFNGQIWLAHESSNPQSKIVGGYMAYPGCTTWDIDSFPANTFIPSSWNAPVNGIKVANNLKTYVNLYQVMSGGDLHHFGILKPGQSVGIAPCYIGSSCVAIQGNTVISTFFIDSAADTKWSMNLDMPPGGDEEIYVTGSNNYIFYQVKLPQDDTVTPTPKNFTKTITIENGTNLLYASLFDSTDEYFAIPQGVGVAIESTDASGTTTHYNTNTNTDNLFLQMTPNGTSVQKLCVKNPTVGEWMITITAMTNTPVSFQFQTVPTSDPYSTMQATLSPSGVLGPQWEEIAYSGFANIANTQSFADNADSDDVELFLPPLLIGVFVLGLLNVATSTYLLSAVQNDQCNTDDVTNTICDAAGPPPSGLKNILLVDANGADQATERLYDARSKRLYPTIESGEFRNNYSKLIGTEATKSNFTAALTNGNVQLISAGGHGNFDRICGYTSSGSSPYTPILLSSDVKDNPALAHKKIFHLLGCRTASGLGVALIANGATAYIGYEEPYEFSVNTGGTTPIRADSEIVKALVDGKTVAEAVVIGKASYTKFMNSETLAPAIIGNLKNDRDALVIKGDGTAKIVANNLLSGKD